MRIFVKKESEMLRSFVNISEKRTSNKLNSFAFKLGQCLFITFYIL